MNTPSIRASYSTSGGGAASTWQPRPSSMLRYLRQVENEWTIVTSYGSADLSPDTLAGNNAGLSKNKGYSRCSQVFIMRHKFSQMNDV
jgi:hypothetical protein